MLTDLTKPDEVSAVLQPSIVKGEHFEVVDAHRDDGKRYVVHADDEFTVFPEWESAT